MQKWLEILAFEVYPGVKKSVTYIRGAKMSVEIIGESPRNRSPNYVTSNIVHIQNWGLGYVLKSRILSISKTPEFCRRVST